ncbi:hypothetical protein [Paludisphaera rhizosphaerae]|uniref:hypothetical protein n=1 Tax=Paludisphaera rhizosphaerae TaxID=2711216 RepID=UPI0013E9E1AE|nr:hypothetical protein [Paludisphaera rhizosphaerae]
MQVKMLRDYVLPDGQPVSDGNIVVVNEELGHKLARFGVARPFLRCRVKEAGTILRRWCDVGDVAETTSDDDGRLEYETAVRGLRTARLGVNQEITAGETKVIRADIAVDMVIAGCVEFAELPAGAVS